MLLLRFAHLGAAPERLEKIVTNPTWQVVVRRSALLCLESFDKTNRLKPYTTSDEQESKPLPSQLQRLVAELLSDKSAEIRALACRIGSRRAYCLPMLPTPMNQAASNLWSPLLRLSCAGYQRGLVELDVPKLLLQQIEGHALLLFEVRV